MKRRKNNYEKFMNNQRIFFFFNITRLLYTLTD